MVFRTALRPQWLALLALALALATAFAALGNWQLGRARSEPADTTRPASEPAVLQQVARPQTSFDAGAVGGPVEATGRFGQESLLVAGRLLDGEQGAWVLSPLVVDDDDGAATLPVVRGWVAEGAAAPAPPAGEVTLTGRLEPSEAPTGDVGGATVTTVAAADLVNRWGSPIYAGFMIAAEPADGLRLIPPVPDDAGGFALQNLSYALQWWVFAAFAVFIWWRMVRDARDQELSSSG